MFPRELPRHVHSGRVCLQDTCKIDINTGDVSEIRVTLRTKGNEGGAPRRRLSYPREIMGDRT